MALRTPGARRARASSGVTHGAARAGACLAAPGVPGPALPPSAGALPPRPPPPIAPVGDPGEVADHVLLEVPGGRPHRRPLGGVDRLERQVVDPGAALERRELLLPGGELLDLGRDLLGVDGVLLDLGPGVGLLVTGGP